MKTIVLFFIIFSFIIGVFGDDVTSVSVMDGDSVTLHTDTELHTDDVILWKFGDKVDFIAKINREANKSELSRDERFRDRLQVDHQTGDLTVRDITTQHTGLYQLKISGVKITEKSFNVTGVFSGDEMKSVSVMSVEGDSVTLHTDVPDIQKYDVIRWRFQHGDSPLAELNRRTRIFSRHDDVHDGIFRDRLQVDVQTGSLTITNIRMKHSGVYEADFSSRTHTVHRSFTVTVSRAVRSVLVIERFSFTLNTDTEIQTDDMIQWMFVPDDSPIAEIYKLFNIFTKYNGTDERFRHRLKLNDQTGDLTIIRSRKDDSGLYELNIINRRRSIQRRYRVIVSDITGILVLLGILGVLLFIAVGVFYCCRVFPHARKLEVMERDSVTLHSDVSKLKKDNVIEWSFKPRWFQKTVIAKIQSSKTQVPDDERFRRKLKLKLNNQTGDLTIRNIRTEHSGLYQLKIISGGKTSYKRYRVNVCDSSSETESFVPLMDVYSHL